MDHVREVQVGDYRPVGLFDDNGTGSRRNDLVILDCGRTTEFGRVIGVPGASCSARKGVDGRIIRIATEGDFNQIQKNRMKAKDALQLCLRKVHERGLPMHMVRAEYTFDHSKIIFFFTAEGRVDFRALVRDLAKIFRLRIELKQIGVRDKAKIIGGYGVCGRELCCRSYMKSFHPLSVKMAKEQDLPLNPSRISGVCGRIKCCMAYEFDVYKQLKKGLPRVGERVSHAGEMGRVIEINIIRRVYTIETKDGKLIHVNAALVS